MHPPVVLDLVARRGRDGLGVHGSLVASLAASVVGGVP
jgi:hypothetical protein